MGSIGRYTFRLEAMIRLARIGPLSCARSRPSKRLSAGTSGKPVVTLW